MNDAASADLVLASGSPRRRQLLTEAGFRFEIAQPRVAESSSPLLSLAELTTCNATRKGLEVARVRADAVVLAADTLVAFEGRSIGKPADWSEAIRILEQLQGRTHQVCTSVFICSHRGENAASFAVISHVQFHPLSREQIESYLARIQPLDKAGAYAAQGDGSEIIREIRGSFTNVVGLPMEETTHALRAFNVPPSAGAEAHGRVRQQISSLFPSGSSQKKA